MIFSPLSFAVVLGSAASTGAPIEGALRITGEFRDPDQATFRQLSGALKEKYGPPLKNTPLHQPRLAEEQRLFEEETAGL